MRRRGLPWLVAMPSVAAGLLAGHGFGSRMVGSLDVEIADHAGHTERAAAHGPDAPILIGFVGALLVVGLALLVSALVRGRSRRSVSPWLFLVLPIVAWPVQELFERLVHAETFGVHAALDPGLIFGITLQIPFGIAAFLVARLLFAIARKVAAIFTKRRPASRRRSQRVRLPRVLVRVHRIRPSALGRTQRAPPLAALTFSPSRA